MLIWNKVPDLNTLETTGANGQAIVVNGPWPVNVDAVTGRVLLAQFPDLLSRATTAVIGLGYNSTLGNWVLG